MVRPPHLVVLCSVLLGITACSAGAPAPIAKPGSPTPAATAAAPAPATPTPPARQLRVGHQSIAANTVLFIATARGYFQREGLDVELVNFSDASQMIPALSTEQLAAAGIAANPAMWNAVARSVPLRVVLDQATFRPGHGTTALLIRKEVYDSGRGHSLSDLRGLTIAFTPPGRGTTNACAMAPALQRAGASFDDFVIQNLPFPDMLPALVNGAVDGAVSAEPFLTRALQQGAAVKLMGLDEMYPHFTVAFIGFSGSLYQDRTTAQRFVRAYLRATRAYLAALAGQSGELSRDDVHEIVARYTGLDIATVRAMVPVGISPNGLPNREAMVYCYRFFREEGLIPQPVSEAALQALWGTELVEEALRDLGRVPES